MNKLLETAKTYFDNNSKLIYSYHGNVFMQDGDLYDHENALRGRIDCSTLVHLALLGLTYDKSPYVSGNTEQFFNTECKWYGSPKENANIDKHILTIREVFEENADRESDIRRAYGLAMFFERQGATLHGEDRDCLMPGDLILFEAGSSVIKEYIKYGAWRAISHVGIVADNTDYMINATGSRIHDINVKKQPVQYTRIADKRKMILAARIKDE